MKVLFENKDILNATLEVQIAREDYEKTYSQKLEEHRKKANFKGFRKGRTPIGYIRKLYGKAVLGETVNEILGKAVKDYLTEHNVDFIGQPIPSPDQEEIRFDTRNLEDYAFKFDMGLPQEFDLRELENVKLDNWDVQVPENLVDDKFMEHRRRHGETIHPEFVEEGDLIRVNAVEIPDDDEVTEPWTVTFSIAVDKLTIEHQKNTLAQTTGAEFTFNADSLEEDRNAEFVRRVLLDIKEPEREISNNFTATIEEISRRVPADINADFLKLIFGGETEVESELEARDKIHAQEKEQYDNQARGLLRPKIREEIMSRNIFDLPEDFLRRYVILNLENPKAGYAEKEFQTYLDDSKWGIVKHKLAGKYNIEATEEEIYHEAYFTVLRYTGIYSTEDHIRELIGRVLQNQDSVQQIVTNINTNKIYDLLIDQAELNPISISIEDFQDQQENARKAVDEEE